MYRGYCTEQLANDITRNALIQDQISEPKPSTLPHITELPVGKSVGAGCSFHAGGTALCGLGMGSAWVLRWASS